MTNSEREDEKMTLGGRKGGWNGQRKEGEEKEVKEREVREDR